MIENNNFPQVKRAVWLRLGGPFLIPEQDMKKSIPAFCKPCIDLLQKQCIHAHTSSDGYRRFDEGETWDDITEVCDDCGAEVTYSRPWYGHQEEIPF